MAVMLSKTYAALNFHLAFVVALPWPPEAIVEQGVRSGAR